MKFGCWPRPSGKSPSLPPPPPVKLEVKNRPGETVMITTGLSIGDLTASTPKKLIQKVDEQNLAIKANTAAIAKLNERVQVDRSIARRMVLDLQNAVELEEKIKDIIEETSKKVNREVGENLGRDWSKSMGDESKVVNNLDERIEQKFREGAEEIVNIACEILVIRPDLLRRGVSQL